MPGADRTGWVAAQEMEAPKGKLTAAEFPEIHIDTTEDMRGRWIKIYPAELLREDGNGVNQASFLLLSGIPVFGD